MIARLQDGTWSAPSCIATGGVGFGFQAGADISEVRFRLLLSSDSTQLKNPNENTVRDSVEL